MKAKNTLIILALLCTIDAYGQMTSEEIQIKEATAAAPEDMRDGATVYGYNEDGQFVLIKKGSNPLICLSDNPAQDGFNTACYHQDLEAFMARGRVLKAEGKSPQEIFDIREEEVQAGKLKMPDQPSTLHILYGPTGHYDAEKSEVVEAKYRYVIYIPYATSESTGLMLKPRNPGDPWLMNPGTHRAHIMVTPPGQ